MKPDDPELMVAKTLINKDIAESLHTNAVYAKTDIMRAIMLAAANRLGGGTETQYVDRPPPYNPPLKAYADAGEVNA